MRNAYVECRIILIDEPGVDDATKAETIRRANQTALAALAKAFGGYTITAGRCGWLAPDGTLHTDQVRVVDVAVPMFLPTSQAGGVVTHETERAGMYAAGILFGIARDYARAADQQCVYVRIPNGDVHLIDQRGRSISPDAVPPTYPHADHYWSARLSLAPLTSNRKE